MSLKQNFRDYLDLDDVFTIEYRGNLYLAYIIKEECFAILWKKKRLVNGAEAFLVYAVFDESGDDPELHCIGNRIVNMPLDYATSFYALVKMGYDILQDKYDDFIDDSKSLYVKVIKGVKEFVKALENDTE